MSKARITEIFRSIQGEGPYAGFPQVFVRFFECNMHCVWCDTPASIGDTTRHYEEIGLDEMIAMILSQSRGIHSVSLTGGEPLMQTEFIAKLIPQLKNNELKVYLETNGIYAQELSRIIDNVDYISMDMKLPSSTQCQAFWSEHEAFLKVAIKKQTFIKAVITIDTVLQDVIRAAKGVADINKNIVFILQPNSFELQNELIEKCQHFQNECINILPNTRVMLQMHRMMKVR